MGESVVAGGEFPAADCAVVLRFLREWVIAVHMRKEDDVLAPAIALGADENMAAVVGELLRLHEEIAELACSLVLFWEPIGDLTQSERAGFAETVHALVGRLERRLQLEEGPLFSACDATVPADDQLDWLQRFSDLERDRGSRGGWTMRIDAISSRWLN